MKKFLLMALAVVAMASCSRQDEITPTNNNNEGGDVTVNDFRLRDDEIAKRARMAVQDMGTKTSSAEIKDIAVIMRSDIQPASRVAEDDTIMYSVNFVDDNGFVLMSTDKRVPVLAMAEQGNFYGHTDNPGLQLFLDRSEDYIKQTIEQEEARMDSLANELKNTCITDGEPEPSNLSLRTRTEIKDYILIIEGSTASDPPFPGAIFTGFKIISWGKYITNHVNPKLKVAWNQNPSPYNSFFPLCSGSTNEHHPAGCGTIALAQIFSHFEQPKKFIDPRKRVERTLNWTNLKSQPNASYIGYLDKEYLGLFLKVTADLFEAESKCSGTGIAHESIKNNLKKLGYLHDDFIDYNLASAINSINLSRPVLISGYDVNGTAGHYWVLDGYREYRADQDRIEVWTTIGGEPYERFVKTTQSSPDYYFYCNWGHGGGANGYYASGVWDEGVKPNLPASVSTKTNYSRNVRIMSNIRH